MAIRKIVSRSIGTDVIAAEDLANNSVTVAEISDGAVTEPKTNFGTSTDALKLPQGTTAQEPTAADYTGAVRYDTDKGVLTYSNGTSWFKVSAALSVLDSVSGNIYVGVAGSGLTLTGTGFLTDDITVNFTQSSDSIDEDVVVTASSDTSATVTIPAAVYNNVTAGNVVTITVTNADGSTSDGVNTTALALPSGGTITTSGDYRYHTFTSSGNFVNTISSLSAGYLIVAGGGGGGNHAGGGGGGAGGFLTGSTTASAQTYSIVVGAGGAKVGTGSTEVTNDGNDSTGLGFTAIGGGRSSYQTGGDDGGSGGGGMGNGGQSSGGSGTTGQGNDGGDAGASQMGGGGGGAGAAGADSSSGQGGAGGVGLNTLSAWATATSTGDSGYYAGGGGGGCHATPGTGGSGGSGGGATGASYGTADGGNGSTNTGGGGGGAGGRNGQNPSAGGSGGSGIVIIRYDVTAI